AHRRDQVGVDGEHGVDQVPEGGGSDLPPGERVALGAFACSVGDVAGAAFALPEVRHGVDDDGGVPGGCGVADGVGELAGVVGGVPSGGVEIEPVGVQRC